MALKWDPNEVVAEVEAQERELVFDSFGHDDAWDLGSLVVGIGRARELTMACAIDLEGQRVFQAGLPGSSAENDSWMNRKIRAVREFGEASFAIGRRIEVSGKNPDDVLDTALYAGHGGGFPIRVAGQSGTDMVGVLVISGLPQEVDHALAVECIRLFLATQKEN